MEHRSAVEMLVSSIVRMHSDSSVSYHSLETGCGDCNCVSTPHYCVLELFQNPELYWIYIAWGVCLFNVLIFGSYVY